MRFLFKSLQLVALFAAFLLEAAVLYFPTDGTVRLWVGLLLIVPIAWIVARTGVVEMIAEFPDAVKKRRFTGLRKHVVQLLDEIRRLNWMAVDAERGFRNREEAMREMDAIEARLGGIISEIRQAAGQRSPEPDLDVEVMPGEDVAAEGSDSAPEAVADGPSEADDEARISSVEEPTG